MHMAPIKQASPFTARTVPTHTNTSNTFGKMMVSFLALCARSSAAQSGVSMRVAAPMNLTLTPSVPIEAYDPKNTTYQDLIDYQTMQETFAGPVGALALKLEAKDGSANILFPYCSASLIADNLLLTAGHCDLQNENAGFNPFAGLNVTFLNCYQEALDASQKDDGSEFGQLRTCYGFDVIDRYSVFEYRVDGEEATILKDYALFTLENNVAGQLFGTLGIDLFDGFPIFANHHANGAPLHHSPLITLNISSYQEASEMPTRFALVRGDLMPGSSGSAQVNELGQISSVTSWGTPGCLGDEDDREGDGRPDPVNHGNYANVEAHLLIRRSLQSLQDLDLSEACETVPEVAHAPIENETCVIGSQTAKSIYESLPDNLRNILEENANATAGSKNFTAFSEHMMHCLCNGIDFNATAMPTASQSPSVQPSYSPSSSPTLEPSETPSTAPTITAWPTSVTLNPTDEEQSGQEENKGKRTNLLAILLPVVGGTAVLSAVLYYLYQKHHLGPDAGDQRSRGELELPEI